MMKKRIISLLMSAFMFMYGALSVTAAEEVTTAEVTTVSEEDTAPETTAVSEDTTAFEETTKIEETTETSAQTTAAESESKSDSETAGKPDGSGGPNVDAKGTVSISAVVTNPTVDGALSGVFDFVVEGEDAEAVADCLVYRNGAVIAEMNDVQLPLELALSYDAVAVVELPVGTYYVSQLKSNGYTTSDMERTVNIAEGREKELEFENRFVTGKGFIKLYALADSSVQVPFEGIFAFHLVAANGRSFETKYTVYDENDSVVASGVIKLPCDIELEAGQYAIVEAKVGSYTVAFKNSESFAPKKDIESFDVSEGQTTVAMSRYTYKTPAGKATVSVDIKAAVGVKIPNDSKFSFTVIGGKDGDEGFCSIYLADGTLKKTVPLTLPAAFSFSVGEYAELQLPEGDYTVLQDPAVDFLVQTEQEVTVVRNKNVEVGFTNSYVQPKGTLEVGVRVDYPVGPAKPVGDSFKFTVSGEVDLKSVEYTVYNADGSVNGGGVSIFPIELELEDGMYAHVALPANTAYTVTMDRDADYRAESLTERVSVRKNAVTEVVFRNSYIEPVGYVLLDVEVLDDRYAEAPDDVFKFTLKGDTYKTKIAYSVYNSRGELLGAYMADYGAILELNEDQFMLIELTPGDYTVTQLDIENYIITEDIAVTVEKNYESEALFVNQYVEPLGKIVIERDGLGENESFVFSVIGTERSNKSVSLTVVLPEGVDSVTVGSLPMGTYRIEPIDEWSVRYVANSTVDLISSKVSTVELELKRNGDEKNVTYEFEYSQKLYWLLGEAYLEKRYSND